MPRVYLDSCIVIYMVEGTKEIKNALCIALNQASETPYRIFVSDLTRLECRVYPLRKKNRELLANYDSFFTLSELTMLPLSTEVIDLATELRAEYRIKTPDAIHLASAIIGGCAEFWTNDNRIAAVASKRIQVIVPIK